MAEKKRNFQSYLNFPKRIFLYWKSKNLEDNAKNILNSFYCSAMIIRRTMERLNVIIVLKCYLCFVILNESIYRVEIMSEENSEHFSFLGFLKQSIIGKQLLILKEFECISLRRG